MGGPRAGASHPSIPSSWAGAARRAAPASLCALLMAVKQWPCLCATAWRLLCLCVCVRACMAPLLSCSDFARATRHGFTYRHTALFVFTWTNKGDDQASLILFSSFVHRAGTVYGSSSPYVVAQTKDKRRHRPSLHPFQAGVRTDETRQPDVSTSHDPTRTHPRSHSWHCIAKRSECL